MKRQLKSIALELTSEDFASQVNEIHNSCFSDYEKRKAFVEIGLRNDDLRALFGDRYIRPIKPLVFDPSGIAMTFGVEIECIVARASIMDSATVNGVTIAYEHYNHIDNNSYYKFVTDASIRSDEGDRDNGIECVSPILSYDGEGLESLRRVCKALNEAGAKVNKSTGLHVHIGAKDLTGDQIVNVYKNYQRLESLIDSFMAPSRRDNGYARSISRFDFNSCHSATDVDRIMGSRYYKVNPEAYLRHHTIEFRQHQGSTNYAKISKWVSFCAKLVAWSKTNVLESQVTDIRQVPFLTSTEKAFFAKRISELLTSEE